MTRHELRVRDALSRIEELGQYDGKGVPAWLAAKYGISLRQAERDVAVARDRLYEGLPKPEQIHKVNLLLLLEIAQNPYRSASDRTAAIREINRMTGGHAPKKLIIEGSHEVRVLAEERQSKILSDPRALQLALELDDTISGGEDDTPIDHSPHPARALPPHTPLELPGPPPHPLPATPGPDIAG